MYLHKIKVSACIALLLLIPIILASCKNRNSPRPVLNFTELYEAGNRNSLTLTIYYAARPVTYHIPWSVEGLTAIPFADNVDNSLVERIFIRNVSFDEHSNLLKQLDTVHLTPVEEESQIHAQFHYIFEAGRRAFTVSGWTRNGNFLINGVEVEGLDPIFYRVLIPFVPEYLAERFERWAAYLESD